MKVALIANTTWFRWNLVQCRRMTQSLVAEGIQPVLVVPQPMVGLLADLPQVQVIACPSRHWSLLRDWVIRGLGQPLQDAGVDLIHLLDWSIRTPVRSLSRKLGVPWVCSLWSKGAVDQFVVAHHTDADRYIVPTESLLNRARHRSQTLGRVSLVPMDVGRSAPMARVLSDPQTISCFVLGNGRSDGAVLSMLRGLSMVPRSERYLMLFCYAGPADQHELWQAAKRLDVLDRISLVEQSLHAVELLLQADVMIQPQRLGVADAMLLEAMATGRPVIAHRDASLNYLVDGQTAILLNEPAPMAWQGIFQRLLDDQDELKKLGERASAWVKQTCPPGSMVAQLKQLYEKMVTPRPMAFAGSGVDRFAGDKEQVDAVSQEH